MSPLCAPHACPQPPSPACTYLGAFCCRFVPSLRPECNSWWCDHPILEAPACFSTSAIHRPAADGCSPRACLQPRDSVPKDTKPDPLRPTILGAYGSSRPSGKAAEQCTSRALWWFGAQTRDHSGVEVSAIRLLVWCSATECLSKQIAATNCSRCTADYSIARVQCQGYGG